MSAGASGCDELEGGSQFTQLLDEYVAMNPVKTSALSAADLRFAARQTLLLKSKFEESQLVTCDARLSAILLVLFAETLSGDGSILGMRQQELFELLERSISEGGVLHDELLQATMRVDLKGHGIQLAQSDEVRRLCGALAGQTMVSGSTSCSSLPPSVNEHGEEAAGGGALGGGGEEEVLVPRELPTGPMLQRLAERRLEERGKHSFQVLTFTMLLLTCLSAYLPEFPPVIEALVLMLVPMAFMALSAALMPGEPSRGALPFVVASLLIGAVVSIYVAYKRYMDHLHVSLAERLLRCTLSVVFGLGFCGLTFRTLYENGRRLWGDVRFALATANAVRIVVVVALRCFITDTYCCYPPGLPFVPALFCSVGWVLVAAAATVEQRHAFAAWTGGTAVLLRLRDIKPAAKAE